jgi:hypothetical protein
MPAAKKVNTDVPNRQLSTIKIKGKDYVMVHERLKFFREWKGDTFSLVTKALSVTPEFALFVCEIADGEGRVVATGHGQEFRGQSGILATSYVEVAETSAIGRALGMFGIGIDNGIATAEEVRTAIKSQEAISQPIPAPAQPIQAPQPTPPVAAPPQPQAQQPPFNPPYQQVQAPQPVAPAPQPAAPAPQPVAVAQPAPAGNDLQGWLNMLNTFTDPQSLTQYIAEQYQSVQGTPLLETFNNDFMPQALARQQQLNQPQ